MAHKKKPHRRDRSMGKRARKKIPQQRPEPPQIIPPELPLDVQLENGNAFESDDMMVMAARARLGRPRKEIDIGLLDFLCAMQCSLAEISNAFRVSDDTIERRIKEQFKIGFAEYFRQHRTTGFVSLRRAQYVSAIRGDVQMQKWLGRQWLEQKDEHVITGADGQPLVPQNVDVYAELAKTLADLGIVVAGKNGRNNGKKHVGVGKN